MKGIITVLGKDSVGIIGKICTYLSDEKVNILDISQTILQEYFNMIMIVDFSNADKKFEYVATDLIKIGENLGVTVNLQHEDIFNTMHRI